MSVAHLTRQCPTRVLAAMAVVGALAALPPAASAGGAAGKRSPHPTAVAAHRGSKKLRTRRIRHTRRPQRKRSSRLVYGTASTYTFGKTSVGAYFNGGYVADRKRVNQFSLSQAGSITKLSVYLQPTTVQGSQVLKGVVYADASGSPGARLAVSQELTFSSTQSAGWYDLPLPTPLTVTAGKYWLGVITGGTSGVTGYRWDPVSNSRVTDVNSYSTGPTNPFGSVGRDKEQTSIYATYTPSAPVAPTAPSNLAGTPGNQQVTLSWNASSETNGSVSGYYVFRNGSRVATVSTTGYTDTALVNGTSYTYYVEAYDSAGHVSQPSASVSATPLAPATSTVASDSPSWFGSFSCGCIDSTLYPYTSFVSGHVFPTTDPAGSGRQVLEYAIDNSDQPYSGSLPRGDVEGPRVYKPGDDYYFSVPVLIPSNFPTVPRGQWLMFAEVYGAPYNGAPTNALSIRNDAGDGNHFAFGGLINGSVTDSAWTGPAPDGRWHTITMHIHFATDSTGLVQLWFDGVRQTFNNGSQTLNYPTMVLGSTWDGTSGNFLDINSYRPVNTVTTTPVLYHGSPAVGTTLSSVQSTLSTPSGP